MANKNKGPLHALVVRGLVRVGEANVQVMFDRRPVLSESDLAHISSDGNIIYRGATVRSVGEFCELAIGQRKKKPAHLRRRVIVDGVPLEELFEKLSQPLASPSTPPPDYDRFLKFVAELIQTRFTPEASGNDLASVFVLQETDFLREGFVRGNELEIWEADEKVLYFFRNIAPHSVHDALQHTGVPSGRFPCIKYKITDVRQIWQLFTGSGIDFVLMKYFATSVDDPSRWERLDVPLPLDSSDPAAATRSTKYLHWLVLEERDRMTRHHALNFIWWPSLMPSSGTGKLQIQFCYACTTNGLVEYGPLPVQPQSATGLDLYLERFERLPPPPPPVSLKIRLRRCHDDLLEIVPEEPPLKLRLRKC